MWLLEPLPPPRLDPPEEWGEWIRGLDGLRSWPSILFWRVLFSKFPSFSLFLASNKLTETKCWDDKNRIREGLINTLHCRHTHTGCSKKYNYYTQTQMIAAATAFQWFIFWFWLKIAAVYVLADWISLWLLLICVKKVGRQEKSGWA